MSETRLASLDALRGLAATIVALGHLLWIPTQGNLLQRYGGNGDITVPESSLYNLLIMITAPSEAWVMVFFLLSGYVVEPSLHHHNPRKFLARRLTRVYVPAISAYVLWSALEYILHDFTFQSEPLGYLLDIALINNGIPGISGPWLMGVLWTLWFEVRYYVFSSLAHKFKFSVEARVIIPACLSLALVGLNLIWPATFPAQYATVSFGVCFIGLGALIFKLHSGKASAISISAFATFGVTLYLGSRFDRFDFFTSKDLLPFWMALALFITALWIGSISNSRNRVLANLGKYSYSIYLSHPVFGIGSYLVLAPMVGSTIALVLGFVFMVLGALLFFKLVEEPSLRLIRRLY